MCLILDADSFSDYLSHSNIEMQPVRNWISKKKGRLVYSPTKRIEEELQKHQLMKDQIKEYMRSGRLKLIAKNEVMFEERKLKDLRSNDGHIVALAIVSNTRLLISKDRKLQYDFSNIVKGKIYKNRTHKHLLRRDICP